MEEILNIVNSLLSKVSFRKVLLVIFLISSIGAIYSVFESRKEIIDSINKYIIVAETTGRFQISKETEDATTLFIRSTANLKLLTILSLNLTKNLRYPEWSWKASDLDDAIKHAQRDGRDGIVPIWTRNEVQNVQMLNVVNGEFFCGPTDNSGIFNVYPEIKGKIVYTCRTPIPPRYGFVTGYIAMHFSVQPNDYELERIKIRSKQLAIEIYERDVKTH